MRGGAGLEETVSGGGNVAPAFAIERDTEDDLFAFTPASRYRYGFVRRRRAWDRPDSRRAASGVRFLVAAVHVVGHEVDRVDIELHLGHLGVFEELCSAPVAIEV